MVRSDFLFSVTSVLYQLINSPNLCFEGPILHIKVCLQVLGGVLLHI